MTREGSSRSSRKAPMEYLRIGPTPWLSTSQPASVSIGEPQLPICRNSQRVGRLHERLPGVPEMEIVGIHQVEVLAVLARDHDVLAADPAREKRHALALHLAAVQRADLEVEKIAGFQHLGNGDPAIVGGVGRDIGDAAVVLDEPDEARILDPVRFVRRTGKDDPFGQGLVRRIEKFVIRLGQVQDAARRCARTRCCDAARGGADT